MRPLIGKVDVVLVHEPALIAQMLAELRDDPPDRPLVFVVGHTHQPSLERQPNVDVINGGSIGGGGTGNLADGDTDVGLARMSYDVADGLRAARRRPRRIDPGHRRGDREARPPRRAGYTLISSATS